MKKMCLIFSVFFLFAGCNKEETKQEDNLINESATIYYYFDSGFGTSQCSFVIETETEKIFVPNTLFDLSEFTSNNGSNSENNLIITYSLTEDRIDRCFHKDDFLENSTIVIEITTVVRI